MLNRVTLIGRLTKDLDLRYTPNGVAVANGNIAVNRPFTNQDGEREADFLKLVIWRKQAENAANYVGKGSLVGIDGRLQSRSYENNEGQRVFVVEVVADSVQFLDSKGSREESGSAPQSNSAPKDNNALNDGEPIDVSDHDLPF